jgi:hypothetical protein
MSKKATASSLACETDQDLLVKLEFGTINGRPFLGQVSDDELLYIWVEVLKRKSDELFGVTSTKSLTRNVRATYKLKQATPLSEIISDPEFSYEKFLDDGTSEVITGRILGFGPRPVEIGATTKVTVKTNFGVEASGVLAWLKLFGTVQPNPHPDFAVNKNALALGIRSDIFEAEVTIKRHIPEFLPMYGQKVQVQYPGIPKMCNRCYITGHLRRECQNKKRDWIEYIVQLVENESIKKELLGSWKNAIARWENARSSQ